MEIKNHGSWKQYQPTTPPKAAPANTLFSRRESDGVDWYAYVNSGENFAADSIKITTREGGFVGAAVADPTMLFPGDGGLLEVIGYSGDDPQKAFGGKIYDAAGKAFRDPPPPEAVPSMADLLKRLEALEAKGT